MGGLLWYPRAGGRLGRAVAATAGLCLLVPAGARADSIVFERDDDIFLIKPNGTGEHRVTSNGSSRAYWSPSQADDGTIVAVRDASPRDKLVRMRQNGEVLSEFTPAVAAANPLNTIRDAAVSPDGTKIAYVTSWAGDSICSPSGSGSTACWVFAVTSATGPTNLGSEPFRDHPSWIDNSKLLVETDYSRMATYTIGGGDSVNWFGRDGTANPGPGDSLYDGEVSAGGDKVVTTAWQANSGAGFSTSVLLWTTNGPPPAQPTPKCRIGGAAGGKFSDPSWAPDGSAVAWEEGDLNRTNAPGPDEGIWVIDGNVQSKPCDQLQGGLLVAGGQEPDWGPANIAPPAAQNSSTPGTTTPTATTTNPTANNVTTTVDTTPPVFTFTPRGQKLGTVLKKGYALTVTTNEPGAGAAQLTASGAAARGLKVTTAKTATVAKGTKPFPAAGSQTLVLKFTKKARKRLARKRSIKLTLTVTVADAAKNSTSARKTITLKR